MMERPLHEEFTRRLAERAENVPVGLHSDPATEAGDPSRSQTSSR
ncbi:hypothetical protein AB0L99_25080 [Streptomyces sp. NPDC051954]